MSAPLTRCAIRVQCVSSAQLINFPWTWGEQRTSGAWKGHSAHPVLFMFAQNTTKFWFAANGMRTVHGWHSVGLQSRPHIRAFGLNHSACSCIRSLIVFLAYLFDFFKIATGSILFQKGPIHPQSISISSVLTAKKILILTLEQFFLNYWVEQYKKTSNADCWNKFPLIYIYQNKIHWYTGVPWKVGNNTRDRGTTGYETKKSYGQVTYLKFKNRQWKKVAQNKFSLIFWYHTI